MWDTSARLLKLLTLLQTRPDWPGPELAERLGVSARTLRRDVGRLRSLGYPVNGLGGTGGGYRLGAGGALPPLLLDDEEAVAVAIGLRTAAAGAAGAVTGVAEASVRALAKLDQVLPARLRHQVATLGAALVAVPASPEPVVDPAVLTALAQAVRRRERLRFDYVSFEGTASVRDVEPYRLVGNGARWYLLAWDTDREGWRTFRVDRLSPRTPTGPRFAPRPLPAEDVGGYLARELTTDQYRYRAVLTMHAPAWEVAQEVPPTIGVVEPVDEHTCTLRIGSDSLDQLAAWLATFGFGFEIREPRELADHARELAGRLARAAG